MKAFAALTLGALLAASGGATAHALPLGPYQGQGQGRGRGHQIDRNSAAYQDGYNQGREDARAGRNSSSTSSRWRARHDRDAYAAGYAQGYQGARGHNERADRDRDQDRDRDRDRDRNQDSDHTRPSRNDRTSSGRFGTTGGNSAEQIGYQDGLNDGAKDRQTGHSFRPTQGDNYKNASRGYNSSMGSKDQYKAVYRQGYANGYQRGYNGR